MIITKTPNRLSLLGGSSDFPAHYLKHGGLVVGGAINKYSYITARYLPPFHDYKTRLVYREIETVNNVDEIRHRAIRANIKSLGMENNGLEIFHASDLPGRSGIGSSSTFVVGLLNALASLQGKLMLPHELAAEAIRIEQKELGEVVGCQDQTFAAFGNFNIIKFQKSGEIDVIPLSLDNEHIKEMENNLMMFYTKISRTSSEIASTYAPTIDQKTKECFAIVRLAELGINAIQTKNWEKLGNLIDQSWRIKAGLSSSVTNSTINEIYNKARLAGAFGGKITGAGGGGMMILVVPAEKQKKVLESIGDAAIHIPFSFEFGGSRVIFSDKDNIREYRKS